MVYEGCLCIRKIRHHQLNHLPSRHSVPLSHSKEMMPNFPLVGTDKQLREFDVLPFANKYRTFHLLNLYDTRDISLEMLRSSSNNLPRHLHFQQKEHLRLQNKSSLHME